jgi:glucose-6-phosphate 1-dehydrogenase
VEAGWQIVDPILKAWARDVRSPVPQYDAKSWGPSEADLLIEHAARSWRN